MRNWKAGEWQKLLRRYVPKGLDLCNCNDAYSTGQGCCNQDGERNGCAANQMNVRNYIASRVYREMREAGIPFSDEDFLDNE